MQEKNQLEKANWMEKKNSTPFLGVLGITEKWGGVAGNLANY